jgi:hypothetical protein
MGSHYSRWPSNGHPCTCMICFRGPAMLAQQYYDAAEAAHSALAIEGAKLHHITIATTEND